MYYNCFWFHQLKRQGAIILYTPLFKEIQKRFTENLWTWKHSLMQLPIETCSSTSNSLIIIGNFWKHLTLIHIKASFFVLYTVIPGYFNELIYEIMKWNISKIKHHSYEVLNLQVYLIVLVLTHAILWDFLQRKGDFYYRNAIFSTFTPWKWIFSNALNHKCSLQWRIHN